MYNAYNVILLEDKLPPFDLSLYSPGGHIRFFSIIQGQVFVEAGK